MNATSPVMRALLIDQAGHTRLTMVPLPDAAPGQVLIRLRTVGYCGSDLNTYRGLNPLVSYPRVPGHEIAGTVERVGQNVPANAEAAAFTGRVVYIGYAKAPVTYDTTVFVKKELDILGARNATLADFHAVMTMLRRGGFPVDATVSRSVSLDDAGGALDDWHRDARHITRIHVEIS